MTNMNKYHFFIFISLILLIYFFMHYYIYIRITNNLYLSNNTRNILKIFLFIFGISFFIAEILSKRLSSIYVKPVAYCGFIWIGIISISISVFFLFDLICLFLKSNKFKYYGTMASIFLIFILSSFSFLNGTCLPKTKTITVKLDKLQKNLSNFSIVQISDVHLHLLRTPKWFNAVIEKVNSLNPDIVVITGDLIDADLCKMNSFCEILKKIRSKYGVYAVTGNHEYYSGVENFNSIAEISNIKLLRNEFVVIENNIQIAGIDDKAFINSEIALKQALKDIEQSKPIILLSHQPDIFDKSKSYGVDLQLSGHTHLGQIPPMDILVMLYFKYPYGLYKSGNSFLYTTSGTGTWGPPMRLTSKSEIVNIILE